MTTPTLETDANVQAVPTLKHLRHYLDYQYPASRGDIQLNKICNKIAELERERDEARATKAILPIHGCLTGDCPHDNANQCVEALKEYVAQMEQAELELQAELTLCLASLGRGVISNKGNKQ